MTIDDESSIYVGGLPHDASQDNLRRTFSVYGHVVAVKIINDQSSRGNCYAFITFTNPRSTIDAINEMDGKTIFGRVVKVSEVQPRGGKSNVSRESYRPKIDRRRDWDRGRDRGRVDHDRGREHVHDRDSDRSRDYDRGGNRYSSRGRDRSRERGYANTHEHDSARGNLANHEQDQKRVLENNEVTHKRKRARDWERAPELDRKDVGENISRTNNHDGSVEKDNDQQSKKPSGSIINPHSREFSSDSNQCHRYETRLNTNFSNRRREHLEKEISEMEERFKEKQQLVLDLQRKSEKLEGAVAAAKKLSSHHRMKLIKLHKCFEQVKDYRERLRRSEEELQSLVDTVGIESDTADENGFEGRVLTTARL